MRKEFYTPDGSKIVLQDDKVGGKTIGYILYVTCGQCDTICELKMYLADQRTQALRDFQKLRQILAKTPED